MTDNKPTACLECGALAGLVVTAALNPWDRGVYLAIINQRPFLSRSNFKDPYRGLTQTLFSRALSSGLYFPLEDYFASITGSVALGGQVAGITIGAILNPFSLIKYQTWGADEQRPFLKQATHMYRKAGVFVFTRGLVATAMRDSLFGVVFATRRYFPADDGATRFVVSALAAGAAATISSPFNFVRNYVYAQCPGTHLECLGCRTTFAHRMLGDLVRNVKSQTTYPSAFRYLLMRLAIGWGTLRVAVGMALTDQCYILCVKLRRS